MHNDVQYKMLQYTFFGKDNGNGEERERIAIDGTEEKETKEEDVFSGRTARTMAYIDGRVEKAHPDSLPLGMPLLNPLLLLQVLLPPICKISILYFLNKQGRETPRKGFFR